MTAITFLGLGLALALIDGRIGADTFPRWQRVAFWCALALDTWSNAMWAIETVLR